MTTNTTIPDQRSLADQIRDTLTLCRSFGYYDAADFIQNVWNRRVSRPADAQRGAVDGTEALCLALYGRGAEPTDYLGGAGAKMLYDAAERLSSATAWLIEYRNPQPAWWDGVRFTHDSLKAVRFARREDAERSVFAVDDQHRDDCVVTEHVWTSSAETGPADAQTDEERARREDDPRRVEAIRQVTAWLDALCECGHAKWQHEAPNIDCDSPCLECDCDSFDQAVLAASRNQEEK